MAAYGSRVPEQHADLKGIVALVQSVQTVNFICRYELALL